MSAPQGLDWNGFRSWYAGEHGRKTKVEQSEAYADYKAGSGAKTSRGRSKSVVKARPSGVPAISPRRPTSARGRAEVASPQRAGSPRVSPKPSKGKTRAASPLRTSPKPVQAATTTIVGATRLCEQVKEFTHQPYDLSSLVCSQLATVKVDWPTVLRSIRDCSAAKCTPCTTVGYRIARSLIRVAATRVFAAPEQSIMEPIVNSFDAYEPSRKVGKFGVGWYSDVYWVVGHPLRRILLGSAYKDASGVLCTYEVVIQEINGALSFTLSQPSPVIGMRVAGKTGFTMRIDATKDPFTADEVLGFVQQVEKLRYMTGPRLAVMVELDGQGDKLLFQAGTKASQPIQVDISRTRLRFNDDATGVPLEVLLGGVLVPSISTKTIQLAEEARVAGEEGPVPESGLVIRVPGTAKGSAVPTAAEKHAQLIILVGDVGVVSIDSKDEVGMYVPVFKLALPASTRVPVSRDDVILTTHSRKVMRDGVIQLLDASATWSRSVVILEKLLEQYITYTASADNQQAIRDGLEAYYEANRQRLVPNKYIKVYREADWDFVGSTRYDVQSIERWLDANTTPDAAVWYGIKALVIQTKPNSKLTVSNGGLYSYLFIGSAYKDSLGTGWVRTITSSYFETKLYRLDAAYTAAEYGKYDVEQPVGIKIPIGAVYRSLVQASNGAVSADVKTVKPSELVTDAAALRLLFAIRLKVDSLTVYFKMATNTGEQVMASLIAAYLVMGVEAYTTVCGELLRRMAAFVGNQTYGASQYKLVSSGYWEAIELVKDVNKSLLPADKRIPYLLDHIVAAVRAIKEEKHTMLTIYTANSPRLLSTLNGKPIAATSLRIALYMEAGKQSRNMAELTAIMAGAGDGIPTPTKVKQAYNNPKVYAAALPGFVAHMLYRIRSRHADRLSSLVKAYEAFSNGSHQTAGTTLTTLKQDRVFAQEWLKDLAKAEDVVVAPVPKPLKGTTVVLSKLIRYLFQHELPVEAKELVPFLKASSSASVAATPLQVIEIAVNEGTVKPPLEAVMTELTQNSLDVIREVDFYIKSVQLALTRAPDSSSVTLSITDYVGMTQQAFVYASVPFLSTKTPSELVTGELGSGFLNVYRESSAVLIDSSRDGVHRRSYDVPIRDIHGRVVDVEKHVEVSTPVVGSKEYVGTRTVISVVIPTPDRFTFITVASRAEYIARYVLGLAMAEGIQWNGKAVYVPRVLMATVGAFELYQTSPDDLKHDSYLLTKGVPFAPLSTYLDSLVTGNATDHLEENYLVNVLHGGYTPVQTRTKIRLTEQAEADLKTLVLYGMFISSLRAYLGGKHEYISHTKSTSDAQQLRVSEYSVTTLTQDSNERYLLNVSFMGQATLAQLLNRCIDAMDDRPYDSAEKDIEATLSTYVSGNRHVTNMVRDAARLWLRPKNTTGMDKLQLNVPQAMLALLPEPPPLPKAPSPPRKGKKAKDYVYVPDPIMQPAIERWLRTYWRLAEKAKVLGITGDAPKADAVRTDKPILGQYTRSTHTITINTNKYSLATVQEVVAALKSRKLEELVETSLKRNALWTSCFAYEFPSCTLAHEVEHSRRREGHEGAHHEGTTNALWPGDTPQVRSFDQAANAVYAKVLSMGLYDELLKP